MVDWLPTITKPANSFDASNNNVTITQKSLTIDNTFDVDDKTYDGKSFAVISSAGNLVGVESADVNKVSFDEPDYAYFYESGSKDKDVEGSNQPKDVILYLDDSNLVAGTDGDETANYTISDQTFSDLAIINKRNITLIADDRSKIYGDGLILGTSLFSLDSSTTYASGNRDYNSGAEFSSR